MSKKILLVDDEEAILDLMSISLSKEGYVIDTALNGLQAIELMKGQDFDLMITDLLMPEMSGMSLIQQVAHDCPEMKIIAITGGGNVYAGNYLEQAITAGAISIIRKPFTLTDFLEGVQKVIDS
jgi:DNA-binding NtrC family response regulator